MGLGITRRLPASAALVMAALALAAVSRAAQRGAADSGAATPTAEQIVARYVEARGGAEAWGRVLSMGWTGHIESGANGSQKIPFLMLFQRPAATRFEIVAQNQRSVRIFDGKRGWKQRPGGETGLVVSDYSPEEVRSALDAGGLDGPLSDYKIKGVHVSLQGAELIEQRRAWKLNVMLPSGETQWHWIDSENYHDLRYDRSARNAMGQSGMVSVYLRDYQNIEGLNLPMVIETRTAAGQGSDRMVIEKIALNPTLRADTFVRPQAPGARHGGVIINTADPRGASAPQH